MQIFRILRTGAFILAMLFMFPFKAALSQVPPSPDLTLITNGLQVQASWNDVAGADGYILYAAPYPSGQPVYSKDLKTKKKVTVTLKPGAAFYVYVTSYNQDGTSAQSNKEFFVLEDPDAPKPDRVLTQQELRWQSCVSGLDYSGMEDGLVSPDNTLQILAP